MIKKNPPKNPLPRKEGALRLGTVRQACDYAPCCHTSLYEFINAGLVDAYKRGARTMIDLDSIDRMNAALPKIVPKPKQKQNPAKAAKDSHV